MMVLSLTLAFLFASQIRDIHSPFPDTPYPRSVSGLSNIQAPPSENDDPCDKTSVDDGDWRAHVACHRECLSAQKAISEFYGAFSTNPSAYYFIEKCGSVTAGMCGYLTLVSTDPVCWCYTNHGTKDQQETLLFTCRLGISYMRIDQRLGTSRVGSGRSRMDGDRRATGISGSLRLGSENRARPPSINARTAGFPRNRELNGFRNGHRRRDGIKRSMGIVDGTRTVSDHGEISARRGQDITLHREPEDHGNRRSRIGGVTPVTKSANGSGMGATFWKAPDWMKGLAAGVTKPKAQEDLTNRRSRIGVGKLGMQNADGQRTGSAPNWMMADTPDIKISQELRDILGGRSKKGSSRSVPGSDDNPRTSSGYRKVPESENPDMPGTITQLQGIPGQGEDDGEAEGSSLVADFLFEGQRMRALIDTGSGVTVVPRENARNYVPLQVETIASSIDGKSYVQYGKCTLSVEVNPGIQIAVLAVVTNMKYDLLLGCDFFVSYAAKLKIAERRMVISTENGTLEFPIKFRFPLRPGRIEGVFSDPGGYSPLMISALVNGVQTEINIDTAASHSVVAKKFVNPQDIEHKQAKLFSHEAFVTYQGTANVELWIGDEYGFHVTTRAFVPSFDMKRSMITGASFNKPYVMLIDFEQSFVILKTSTGAQIKTPAIVRRDAPYWVPEKTKVSAE